MRTVFEDDEEDERAEPDRELTLSTGTLLGLFFALVLVCGLCFGVGYTLGAHSGGAVAAKSGEKAADLPLAGRSAEKPSPVAGNAVAGGAGTGSVGLGSQVPGAGSGFAAGGSTPAAPISDDLTAAPQATGQSAVSGPLAVQQAVSMTAGTAGQGIAGQGASVHPALPQSAPPAAPIAAARTVEAALPAANSAANSVSGAGIMVQVAAVSDPVDAQVLLDALRKRGYAVKLIHGTTDSLMHVQVGPFASRAEALATRQRLLHDGYNAMVK